MSPFSPPSGDDTVSVASSATALQKAFKIPKTWRPSIMECLNAKSTAEKRKKLTPSVRNEIVRDLVTTMYAYMPNPNKAFCTTVAKLLVETYDFLKDVGSNVMGYVSA